MPTLDTILNWIIPPLAVLFFLWIFYKSLKGPLGGLGRAIRGIFGWIGGKARGEEEPVGSIIYE